VTITGGLTASNSSWLVVVVKEEAEQWVTVMISSLISEVAQLDLQKRSLCGWKGKQLAVQGLRQWREVVVLAKVLHLADTSVVHQQ